MPNSISVEVIANKILYIRSKKVMLDKDLAVLYGVKPIALRQQVKRNRERFPEDFMFQLAEGEVKTWYHICDTIKTEICPMPLLSRVWLCFQAFCVVGVRYW